jgi:hypothetical protein
MRDKYQEILNLHEAHARVSLYFNLFFNCQKTILNFPKPDELKSPEAIDEALSGLLATFFEYICEIINNKSIFKRWKNRLRNSNTSHFLDDSTKRKLLQLRLREVKTQDLDQAYDSDFTFFKKLLNPIIELMEMKNVNVSYLTSEGFKLQKNKPNTHLIHALAMYMRFFLDNKSALDCYARLIQKDITLLELKGEINLFEIAEFFDAKIYDPDYLEDAEYTPLHIATAVNNTEVIELTLRLCPKSINYICHPVEPQSPAATALWHGQFKSLDILEKSGAHFDPYGFSVGLNIIFLEKYTFFQKHSTYLFLQAWLKQPLLEKYNTEDNMYRIDQIAVEFIKASLRTNAQSAPTLIKARDCDSVINLFSSFLERQISFLPMKNNRELEPRVLTYSMPIPNPLEEIANQGRCLIAAQMLAQALQKLYDRLAAAIDAETKFVPGLNGIIIDYLLDYKVANPLLPEGVSLKRAGNKFEFFAEIAQPPATACTDSTDMGKGGTKRKLAQPEGSVSRQKIAHVASQSPKK